MKRVLASALALALLSAVCVRGGVALGEHFVPPGAGRPADANVPALFRFDSEYYLDIAQRGYHYNGNPGSSPNLVFAPLFPILVATFSALPGVDEVSAGYVINFVLLVASFTFLILFIETWFSPAQTLATLFALGTCAGAYALHAYYSECTMLASLSLALLAFARGWWRTLAFATVALGASRLAALPMVVTFTLVLAHRRQFWALVAPLGSGLYLLYLAWNFGEPFTLLSEIQRVSWGSFHPAVNWAQLLAGGYLLNYATLAFDKGWSTWLDVQTLNLIWLTLAFAGAAFSLASAKLRRCVAPVFIPYVLFLYVTDVSSPFLISMHRFCVVMVPLFMGGAALHEGIARKANRGWARAFSALLLTLNLAYGLLHAALFNQGHWFWF